MAKKDKKHSELTGIALVAPKTKGILLLALGHPNYSRMASQLAMSIKTSCPEIHITLAKCIDLNYTVEPDFKQFVDAVINVPKEHYTKNGLPEYIKAKTFIYDISPYDETIYLDSDMLWCPRRNVNDLFNELNEVEFTMQNRGALELNGAQLAPSKDWWFNLNDLLPAYELKRGLYYQLASEFIYFKKCDNVAKLFKTAQEVYTNPKVVARQFAGGIPDEVAFSIAMILNNYYPHAQYYSPIYWEQAERKRLKGEDLFSKHYGYSLGGAFLDSVVKSTYDNLTQWFCNQNGIKYFLKATDKSRYLPERNTI